MSTDSGSGPAVLLLHGFPFDHTMWKYQVPVLVTAGYRVIAPDLRGYGETDRPQEPDSYHIKSLIADVASILDALEVEKAAIVGHDWGACLAWAVAAALPERTSLLCAISVGHPGAFFDNEDGARQRQLSWYMLLFLHKPEAEQAVLNGLHKLFPAPKQPPKYSLQEVQHVLQMLARPGAATAGINWYRANISAQSFINSDGSMIKDFPKGKIRVPTLGIMSEDSALTAGQMKASERFIEKPGSWRYVYLPDCQDHMIPWDSPDKLNELLISFLSTNSSLLEGPVMTAQIQ